MNGAFGPTRPSTNPWTKSINRTGGILDFTIYIAPHIKPFPNPGTSSSFHPSLFGNRWRYSNQELNLLHTILKTILQHWLVPQFRLRLSWTIYWTVSYLFLTIGSQGLVRFLYAQFAILMLGAICLFRSIVYGSITNQISIEDIQTPDRCQSMKLSLGKKRLNIAALSDGRASDSGTIVNLLQST